MVRASSKKGAENNYSIKNSKLILILSPSSKSIKLFEVNPV